MAEEVKLKCGLTLYDLLWRPRESASNNLPLLEESMVLMKKDHIHLKKFNPSNKWGSYENLVLTLEKIIEACKEYPESMLQACC